MDEQIAIQIREILSNWTDIQISNMKNILIGAGKVASGRLVESLVKEIVSDTEININMESYGKFVDGGRAPGKFPPISKIKEWCSMRGIPETAAFPIARSIAENGIAPLNFTDSMYEGLNSLTQQIATTYGEYIAKTIKINLEAK